MQRIITNLNKLLLCEFSPRVTRKSLTMGSFVFNHPQGQ